MSHTNVLERIMAAKTRQDLADLAYDIGTKMGVSIPNGAGNVAQQFLAGYYEALNLSPEATDRLFFTVSKFYLKCNGLVN